MTERVFPFRFTRPYLFAGLPFGVTPSWCGVVVDTERLVAHFGLWRVITNVSNIAGVTRTGPYQFIKTAGPAHLSFADRGLTFATNDESGVCLDFHTPITGIEPTGLIRHPNLTLTVADVSGLMALLTPS